MFTNFIQAVKYHLHQLWRAGALCGVRADLSGADLSNANLSGADLRGADLREADLSGADLRRADLSNADLRRADLRRADLRRADLSGADLSEADLRQADLSEADLRWVTGVIHLSFDTRGYVLVSSMLNGAIWFNAGCRSFDKATALAHWGSARYPDRTRGQKYVSAILFLSELWND